MQEFFRKIAGRVSYYTGTPGMFIVAVLVIIGWASSGPIFNFSDTWQLIINTGTTIGTFLMVFLIQNTQNRDGKALQLKLDELIRSSKGARSSFIDLEDISDKDLEKLDKEFKDLHDQKQLSPLLHQIHHRLSTAHKKRHSHH